MFKKYKKTCNTVLTLCLPYSAHLQAYKDTVIFKALFSQKLIYKE